MGVPVDLAGVAGEVENHGRGTPGSREGLGRDAIGGELASLHKRTRIAAQRSRIAGDVCSQGQRD